MTPLRHAPLALLLAVTLASPALAQDHFKDMIEAGDYPRLADRLEEHLDLDKADPGLRTYLDYTLDYLRAGAPQPTDDDAIVVVRGIKNDKIYSMPPAAGGEALFLPPGIRWSSAPYRKRLRKIDRYFTEATTERGGDGKVLHELEKIINDHALSSTGSVFVSASTKPQALWGPKFVIIRIPAERAIFNYTSPFTNEREVLIPFFVLPTEVVAIVDTIDEVYDHPMMQANKFNDVDFQYTNWCGGETLKNNVWERIEANVRAQREPLHHVVLGPPECPVPADAEVEPAPSIGVIGSLAELEAAATGGASSAGSGPQ